MRKLSGADRKYLRSIGHHHDAKVMIGKNGLNEKVVESADMALEANELIKIRFVEHKDEKRELTEELARGTQSEVVGMLGHTALLYREQEDEQKRRVTFPKS